MASYKAKYYVKKSSKSKKTPKSPGAQALKIVKTMQTKFKTELKIAEALPLINTNATSAGDTALMTFVDQGTDRDERIGDIINLNSIHMKGYVQWNAAGNNGQIIKMWIIHDKQQIASTNPSFNDIFDATNIVSTVERDVVRRFSVLGEYTFTQDTTKQILPFSIWKKFTKHRCEYNGVSGAATQKGHLYLAYTSNRSSIQNPPILYMHNFVRYYDN